MKRKVVSLIGLVMVIAVGVGALSACSGNGKYYSNLSGASFWDNAGKESIAQNHFYDIMMDFYRDGKTSITVDENGNVVGADGKIKKIAFIGLDGVRADAMYNILEDTNKTGNNGGNTASEFSGISRLKATGGLYHAYAGGEKNKASEQDTSTSPGWISELTGKLHTEHGVDENDEVMKSNISTIALQLAMEGLNTSITFGWSPLFDINLRNEIKYLLTNADVSSRTSYCAIDRKVAADEAEIRRTLGIDDDDDYDAGTLAAYNFVANAEYNPSQVSDRAVRDRVLSRIGAGDDFIVGLFSAPDGAGHSTGFANSNPDYVNSIRDNDNCAYEIVKAIEERQTANNEDWLILMTTDHGGKGTGHGGQSLECKNIWIASNKEIGVQYFRKNFDGYRENK